MPCCERKFVFTQSLIEANGTTQGINLWDASDDGKLQNSPNEGALIHKA